MSQDDDQVVQRVALEIAGSLMLQMKHSVVNNLSGGDVATVIKLISDRDVCHAMARAALSALPERELLREALEALTELHECADEADKRTIWESIGYGNDFAERFETAVRRARAAADKIRASLTQEPQP